MARPAIEVLHVGSASRDLTSDDPRGWRLGGGVTYAALTTARLGLRTAALIGVDEAGASAHELDLLRAAGVDLVLEPLAEAPVFDNRETPDGRVQICHVVGEPLRVRDVPARMAGSPGLVARPGRRRDRRLLGGASSRLTHISSSAGRGSCAISLAGSRSRDAAPGPSALLERADLVGVSHHDVDAGTSARDTRPGFLHPGRRPARHRRRPGRAADPRRRRRAAPGVPVPADRDGSRDRPDRRRRHVPRGAARIGPAAGHRRAERGRVDRPTCGSRRRLDRSRSKVPGSAPSRTARRSSSGAPGSASAGRSSRARSRRSGPIESWRSPRRPADLAPSSRGPTRRRNRIARRLRSASRAGSGRPSRRRRSTASRPCMTASSAPGRSRRRCSRIFASSIAATIAIRPGPAASAAHASAASVCRPSRRSMWARSMAIRSVVQGAARAAPWGDR